MSLTELNTGRRRSEPVVPMEIPKLADPPSLEPILRRLHHLWPLEDGDRDAVQRYVGSQVRHRVGADLGDDSDSTCRILISGWACRVSETPWGGRQILDVLIPGDTIGLTTRPRLEGLYRVVGLCPGATVDARSLRERLRSDDDTYPSLRRACLKDERANAVRLIAQTNRLGAATAAQAMSHLLLDLRERLAQVGMLNGDRFPMLLSQEILHEALGITVTQVYRVLTQMRRDGLIALGPGWAEIADPSALAAAAGLAPWRS